MAEPENSVIGSSNESKTPKKGYNHLDVLKILIDESKKEFTLNEIQDKLSISYEPAYRYMQELLAKKYVRQRVSAHNQRFFSLNPNNMNLLKEFGAIKNPKQPFFNLVQLPKKESKLLMYVLLVIVLLAAFSPFYVPSLISVTGMFSGHEYKYSESLQVTFDSQEYEYNWDMQNYNANTTLSSVMLSGYTIGDGNVTMYLEDNSGNRLLILDTTELTPSQKSGITGFAINKQKQITEVSTTTEQTTSVSEPTPEPVPVETPSQPITGITTENTTQGTSEQIIYKAFNFLCDETCLLETYGLNQSSYKLYFNTTGNVSVTLTEIDYSLIEPETPAQPVIAANASVFDYAIKDAHGETVSAKIILTPKVQKSSGIGIASLGTSIKLLEVDSAPESKNTTEVVPTGTYDVSVDLQEGPVKKIDIHDMQITADQTDFIKVDDTPESGNSVETYAIDPTAITFTSADVTVNAKGNALYKCKDWDFEAQTCNGKWVLAQKINPGENYTFELNAEDPAFKEIYVLSVEHLDADKNVISDILNATATRDHVWSEPIYNNEYVRAYFDDNMTNGNVINLYPRNTQGLNTKIEIYDEKTSSLVGEAVITKEGQYNVELSGMSGYSDTLLLKIVNTDNNPDAYIEFDYIHDSNWVVPTSWTAASGWTNGQNAYDDNTGTYASDASGSVSAPMDGEFITFYLDQNITSDKLRAYADYGYGYTDSVQVDVHDSNSNSWITIRNGSMLDGTWDEMSYGQTLTVDAARFRWHYSAPGAIFWLYEFQISNKSESNLPVVATQDASTVSRYFAVIHGMLSSDGGEPCSVRFEYGADTSYGEVTPWLPDLRSTGSNFTQLLSDLIYGQTYHFRAQANNSKGIVNGEDMQFTTHVPDFGWLSPNGYDDPNNAWTWEERAFDDIQDSESKAKSYHAMNDPNGQWSFPIILTRTPAIYSNALKFYAKAVDMDMVNISVLKGGAWEQVYSGVYNDLTWNTVNFTIGEVSAAKFEFHIVNNGNGETWELYDVDFYNIPENVIVNESIDNAEGLHINHTLEIQAENGTIVYNGAGAIQSPQILTGAYDITVEPENASVEKIVFNDVDIHSNVTDIVNIDVPTDTQGYAKLYAIDPTAINFTNATVTISPAEGTELMKCKGWDFNTQTCAETCETITDPETNETFTDCYTWQLVQSIMPGEAYNFTLTPEDPAYAEYNYSDITNNKAYNGTSTSLPIATTTFGTIAPSTVYASISTSNDVRWYTRSVTTNNYPYERFNFKINQSEGNLVNVSILWEGFGNKSTSVYGARVYVLNNTANAWVMIGGHGLSTDANVTISYVTNSNISDIINSTGYINVLAEGNNSRSSGGYAFLATDFVNVYLYYNLAPNSTLFSPADGNVTAVNSTNLTCNATDDIQLENITLYWNYSGSWQPNETNSVSGTSDSTVFQRTNLSNGPILWTCYVCDNQSNCSFASENHTVTIATPDMIPPATVTNLAAQSQGIDWIYWNWTNPADADFSKTEVWLNNTFKANTSNEFYNATGLANSTVYQIQTRTWDNNGNVNTTWVNSTAQTLAVSQQQNQSVSLANGTLINATLQIINSTGQTVYIQTNNTYYFNLFTGNYTITITPVSYTFVKNITYYNYTVDGNFILPALDVPAPSAGALRVYAVNPLGNFQSANITINLTGNVLTKCDSYTFAARTCYEDSWATLANGLTPGTLYVITITPGDPGFAEFNGTSATDDSYIRQNSANTNYGVNSDVRVGEAGAGAAYRGIIRFNISTLPSGVRIDNANLSLYMFNNVDGAAARVHGTHMVQQSPVRNWIENQVTWNRYVTANVWTAAGGDFNATASATTSVNGIGWYYWNVTYDVQSFYNNPSNNTGWILKDENEATLNTRKYYSSSENGTNVPNLTINWTDVQAPRWNSSGSNVTSINNTDAIKLYAYWTDNVNLSYAVLSTNETGAWVNYSTNYSSPLAISGAGNWSNFTWSNTSSARGTIGWRIWANDTQGNWNVTDIRAFNITFETVIPVINSINNTPNPVYKNNYMNVSANVTDNINVSSVLFFVNGTNYSMVRDGGNFWNYTFKANLSLGAYNYTIYANDTNGNNATPVTGNFTVTTPALTDPLRSGSAFLIFVPPLNNGTLTTSPEIPVLVLTAFNDNTTLYAEDMNNSNYNVGNSTNRITLNKGESRLIFFTNSSAGDYVYIESSKTIDCVLETKSPWNSFSAAAEGRDYSGEEYLVYARYDENQNTTMDLVVFAYENSTHIRILDITGNTNNKDGIYTGNSTTVINTNGTILYDAILNKSQHIEYINKTQIPGGHTIQVIANKKIGVLGGSFTEDNNGRDGGFYVGGTDGKTASTEFYTYVGRGLNGNEGDLYIFGNEATNVTVESYYENNTLNNTLTVQLNSSNYYFYHFANLSTQPYKRINSTKLISVLAGTWIRPATGDIGDFAPSVTGSGIGTSFKIYIPGPASNGYTHAIVFAYANNTFVEIRNASNNYYFGNRTLNYKSHWDFNLTYETLLNITSTKNVGVEITNYDDNIAFTAVSIPVRKIIVDKTGDKDYVNIGDYIMYSLNITNPYEVDFFNINVTDILMNSLKYVNSTEPSGVSSPTIQNSTPTADKTTVTWNITSLAAGESKVINITAQVNSTDLVQENHFEATGVDEDGSLVGGSDVAIAFLVDNRKPTVLGVTAAPSPQTIFDIVNITANITDDWWVGWAIVTINGTNYSMTRDGGNTWFYEYNGTVVGNYNYTVYAVDSSNNTNGTGTYNFTIVLDNVPAVTGNLPAPGYFNDTAAFTNVTFNCSATDDKGLKNMSLFITNSSNMSFALNQTTNVSGKSNTSLWYINLSIGNYTWNCRAFDTSNQSTMDGNRTILLNFTLNTAPTTAAPTIAPSTAYKTDNLYCNATLTDSQQSGLTAYWTWYKNGIVNRTGITSSITNNTNSNITVLLSGNLTKADSWICKVTPYDGTVNGTAVNSTAAVIQNSIPVIGQPMLNNTIPYTNDLISCTSGSFSDADGDSATWYYRWYVNNTLLSVTSSALNLSVAGNGNKGDNITCSMIASDGTANATAFQNSSNYAIVQNTALTAPTILNPTTGTYGGTNNTIAINCSGSTDADSDAINYTIDAYYDSVWHTISTGNGSYNWNVSPISSQTGVDIRCNATDGTNQTAYYNPAGSLTIDNTKPNSTIVSPSNNTLDPDGSVSFNCTVSDNLALANVSLYINNALNQTRTVTGTGNSTAFNVTGLANGNYTWYCKANDSLNNFNDTVAYNITIDRTSVPAGTNFTGNTTNWSAVADIHNVCNGEAYVDVPPNGSIKWFGCVDAAYQNFDVNVRIFKNFTTVDFGLNPSFNASAELTIRNLTWSDTEDFSILMDGQTCPGTVCQNVTYNSTSGVLVFNVTHFTNFSTSGTSRLTIWDQNDTGMPRSGRTACAGDSIDFFANYSRISGGNYVSNTGATCTVNFTDSTGNSATYNATSTYYEYARTFNSTGVKSYNISCVKTTAPARPFILVVDNITITDCYPPKWYSNQTNVPSSYAAQLSLFNITWTDEVNVSTAWFESNFTGSAANYSMRLIAGNTTNGTWSYNATLAAGTYYWKSYANDTSNLWNSTNTWIFTIVKASNPVHLFLNGTEGNNTYTYQSPINATGTAAIGTVYVYRNGTLLISGTSPQTNMSTLANNTYMYTVNATGNANYSDNTTGISYYAFVNKATSTCSLSFNPASGITYGAQTNATCTCTNPEATAQLYRNGTNVTNEINTNVTLGAGAYGYLCNVSATQNYTSATNSSTYGVNKALTNTTLYLNGTRANKTYDLGDYANFTVIVNVSGKTVYLNTTIPGFTNQSGATPLINITRLNSAGVFNITGSFLGDENYTASYETWFANVSDTTKPTISSVTDTPDPLNQSQTTNITAVLTDNGAISKGIVQITLPNSTVANYTMTKDGGNTWFYEFGSTLQPGQYNYTIYTNDTSGNWNSSTGYSFTVNDVSAPLIQNALPANGTTYHYNNIVLLSANVTDMYWNSTSTVTANVTWDSTFKLLSLASNGTHYVVNFTNTTYYGTYTVAIKANDSYGNTNYSYIYFVVQNDIPVAASVNVTPDTAYTTDNLKLNATCTDSVENPLTVYYTWYKNAVLNRTGSSSASNNTNTLVDTLLDGNTTKGENWSAQIICGDGFNNSTARMDYVVIQNSVPTVPTNVTIVPSSVYTDTTVTCTASGSTDSDNDTITYWYKFNDTTTTLQDWSTINTFDCNTPGCDRGDTLYCYAIASTSDANSTTNKNSTTILNMPPVASGVAIKPDNPTVTDNLTCNYTYSDADSNAESGTTFKWFKDGALQTWTSSTVLFSNLSNGQKWICEVTPKDGTDFGTAVNSSEKEIGSSAPSIVNVTDNSNSTAPTNVGNNVTFTIFWSDPDAGQKEIVYICNSSNITSGGCAGITFCSTSNSTNNPQSCNYTTQQADNTTVTYYAIVCDETNKCSGIGGPYTFDVNHAPNVTKPTVSSPLYTNSIATCTAGTFADPDGDAAGINGYKWYKNNVIISGETGTTLNLSVPGYGNKGDSIICEETPVDQHTLSGAANNSSAVVIQNSAPEINVTQPDGINDITAGNYNVTWTATDNDTDAVTVSCYADNNNVGYDIVYTCFTGVANNGNNNCDTHTWASGTYYIWCNATDGTGYSTGYSSGPLNVDTTPPAITVQSPSNTTYNVSRVWFNATTNENASWCGYSLDGATNVSMTNSTGNWNKYSIVSQGLHNVVFYCNDTLGNMNLSQITYFTIDTVAPSYSANTTSPSSPTTYAPGASYQFNITWTDATTSVNRVIFEFNGANYTPLQNGNVYYITLSNLAANTTGYSYRWYANDSVNNMANTPVMSYVINKADPSSNLKIYLQEAEADAIVTYPTSTNATGMSTLANNQDMTFVLYKNGSSVATGMPATQLATLGAGYYVYVYNTTGGANYTSGTTVARYLAVNNANDFVNLTLNIAQTSIVLTYGTALNASAISVSGTDQIYRNGTNVTSQKNANITLAAGYYAYKANTTGNANYTANATGVTYYVTVNQIVSTCSLSFNPASGITYGTQTNATCTCTNPEATAKLYRNGSDVTGEKNTNVTLGAGVYSYVCNVSESQNYTSASDSSAYSVKQAPTLTALYINGTQANRTYNLSDSANFTVTLNISGKTVYLVTDIPAWTLQNSATPLVNLTKLVAGGIFNITGYFSGDDNYTSSYETWFINVTDLVKPTLSNAAATSPVNQSNITNITADLTDNGAISSGITQITYPNGTVVNYTMTHDGGNTWFLEFSNTFQPGQYNVTVFANDTYGNWNSTSGYNFTVNDISAPDITSITAPSTQPNNNVTITANVTDIYWNLVDTVLVNVSWDNTSEMLVMNYNSSTGLYEVTFTNTTLEGTYNITIIANDTSGNTANATSSFIISAIIVTPPSGGGVTGPSIIGGTIAVCGDNSCNGLEDCKSCQQDCGACPSGAVSGIELFEKVNGTKTPIADLEGTILTENGYVYAIKNRGNTTYENVTFRLIYPDNRTVLDEIHYGKQVGWNSTNIIGWQLLGRIANPRLTEWINLDKFVADKLEPGAEIDLPLEILPPITRLSTAELVYQVLSNGHIVAENRANLHINMPNAIVKADYIKDSDTLDLYIIVNNKNNSNKLENVYIEFNMNDGKTTKLFELFGPYKINANDAMIIADKYKLADDIGGKTFGITVKVYDGITRLTTAQSTLDISSRQTKEVSSVWDDVIGVFTNKNI